VSDEPRAERQDPFIHEPLPYVVKLRTTISDDAPPATLEFKVVAYSVWEALSQALMEAGATSPDGSKHTVESIGPNVAAWWALKRMNRRAEEGRDGRKKTDATRG